MSVFIAGTELMTIILGKKRAVRYGAFRALDFATTRCAAACERFVDHNGLKLLFAVFMGKVGRRLRYHYSIEAFSMLPIMSHGMCTACILVSIMHV